MTTEQPGRPRRSLGLPGQARPQEWQESAYAEEPDRPAEAVAEEAAETPPEAVQGGQVVLPHGRGDGDPAGPLRPVQGPAEALGGGPTPGVPEADRAPRVVLPHGRGPAAAPEAVDPGGLGVPVGAALEAVLMVADEPVGEGRLADVVGVPRAEVGEVLRELAAQYTAQGRGFDLRLVAGGWRFYSRAECAPAVERFVLDGQQARLTQAALETLAVVAYRQPVSRGRVSAVRGVNCDGVMRTLVQRGLVEEAGSEPETGAILYRTTNYFLERMGLRGLDELPELAPFLPEVDDVEAESLEGTMIAEAVAAAQEGTIQTEHDVRTI